ncbi:bifunctional UDP-N-acetylmuramoyl-tripeptide:D-alanyl-D-alanine ligase/alanine racemase [Hymenobacter busanensis]|uniref:Alanine racemase n=1 Tax=Hymenobacter busanensis TaxID=2607656 RepID=A0A7L5A063_9BACT|nr:bifunctional UDP-N-acetylmuramoyl-tripeptide:D-alanyl-D-alanine ligase/alanine racemase [Hymenobacter busanensis]KAA9331513.1 bifunctional UDP-N-acetylmuramoyl-tripeptide:D-alanyl-D-alanine ligase/alanine racemase [Hymenobacter busanensis]QHJ08667.1 bifunctional UDP-N-acetylmuramoyl-tripeptide:D-alanyl-D-alanine ligase/alanine racemase [Hymenobacter busanensis]
MLRFASLPALLGGTLLQAPTDAAATVQHLLLDSRRVGVPAGTVFFALRGPHHDGHQYIAELYQRGVRLFVVEVPVANLAAAYSEAGFVQVNSALEALQQLAAQHRQGFGGPVWAITGSNGKTIVKEWLAQLLSPDELICRSPRSYNSQVGVPLSVWELRPQHTLGIFEAGISEPDEMARLAHIIQPTAGIFTNLGPAHDAGFASREQKAAEKMQLFAGVERLVYCRDHAAVHAAAAALPASVQRLTWSRHAVPDAAVQVALEPSADPSQMLAKVRYAGTEEVFTLPFADEPSVENVLHCLTVLLWRGLASAEIQRRLLRLHPVAMRLEMKQAIHDCYVLDDTYNNDLTGLDLALDALQRQPRRGRRTLILSDVLESGLAPEELYGRVAELAAQHGVQRLLAVGEAIGQHQAVLAAAVPEVLFFADTEALLAWFHPDKFRQETILVKGARRFGFERVVAAFQQKIHGTVLEVNLDALVHNLNYYRARLQPGTRLMVMVKAFAYGSSSYEVANLLEFHRVDYLAVAYTDEGVQLRENGISLPIMVMNPSPDSFGLLRQYHLEPEIYSFARLREYLQAAAAGPLPAVHLKLDTGMRRLGFDEADLDELLPLLRQHATRLRVASALTHLAGADEEQHNDFSRRQLSAFQRMAARLENELGYPIIKHALNSPGILRFPEAHFDMVRLGIGLYGVEAAGLDPTALRPVSNLRTTVSQIKQLPAGETVGYGRRGDAADYPRRIATLAIGYADGYDRRFSRGVGEVLIRGQRAPLVGNVCMDMCMVDVSGIADVQEGDTALVFGEGLGLTELAKRIGTIPYELLTSVSERVKRIFVSE